MRMLNEDDGHFFAVAETVEVGMFIDFGIGDRPVAGVGAGKDVGGFLLDCSRAWIGFERNCVECRRQRVYSCGRGRFRGCCLQPIWLDTPN